MKPMWLCPLPYLPDSAPLFERFAGRRGAVFLDSGPVRDTGGRYDIIAAAPAKLVCSRGGVTEVEQVDGERSRTGDDAFDVLRAQLWSDAVTAAAPCPFLTGAVGYFGYDLGRRLEQLPPIAADREQLPEMLVGIYDWAVVVDHLRRGTTLVGRRSESFDETAFNAVYREMTAPASPRPPAPCRIAGPPVSNMDRRGYIKRFNAVRDYIRAGDCYQVNLAQKFTVSIECDPWEVYKTLRRINSAPFSAYLDFGEFQVLSISPERFLRLSGRHVETKPVKGTRPRRRDRARDRQEVEALRNSSKDRAENLMIVDLLRNDIGKTCLPGSIRVSKLFDIESFANVHHLVSTIEGDLADGRDGLHLLRGCFPGGSITGAPKLRAMEIIEELEPDRRGVYCGAIGYLSRHGDMDLNIAIRTAVHRAGRITFFGGGGIVADSEAEVEYQETLDKVSSMMRLFEELRGSQR